VWWKLHDTIGPAIYLQLEQDDDFFDILDARELLFDDTDFLSKLFLHHFDDVQQILDAASVNQVLDLNQVFDDPNYWNTDI